MLIGPLVELGLLTAIHRIAIWERKLTVVVPLIILCLAHWGLLYHGIIIVRAVWDPVSTQCIVNQTNSAILKFTFFASRSFIIWPEYIDFNTNTIDYW